MVNYAQRTCVNRVFHNPILDIGPVFTVITYCFTSMCTVISMFYLYAISFYFITFGYMIFVVLFCTAMFFFAMTIVSSKKQLVPERWEPPADNYENLKSKLEYCQKCMNYKPPRAHHCRQCDQCILMFDHHCPWTNTCVGIQNRRYFMGFVAATSVGCAYCLSVGMYPFLWLMFFDKPGALIHLYEGPDYPPPYWLIVAVMLSAGIQTTTMIASVMLTVIQLANCKRNSTKTEQLVIDQAEINQNDFFVNPFDLGCWVNLKSSFKGPGGCQGILDWPVRKGSDQCDLVVEHIRQKRAKRQRCEHYIVNRPYKLKWYNYYRLQGMHIYLRSVDCSSHALVYKKTGRWAFVEILETGSKGWMPLNYMVEKMHDKQHLVV